MASAPMSVARMRVLGAKQSQRPPRVTASRLSRTTFSGVAVRSSQATTQQLQTGVGRHALKTRHVQRLAAASANSESPPQRDLPRLAPAAVYAALAFLGVNIGLTDIFTAAQVPPMLGYALAETDALSLAFVRVSGGSHLPVAGAFAALWLERLKGGQLPPPAVRALSTAILMGVVPLYFSVREWVARGAASGSGLTPVVIFILARLAVEASVGALPLFLPPSPSSSPGSEATSGAPRADEPDAAGATVLGVAAGTALALAAALIILPHTLLEAFSGTAVLVSLTPLAADMLPALAGGLTVASGALRVLAEDAARSSGMAGLGRGARMCLRAGVAGLALVAPAVAAAEGFFAPAYLSKKSALSLACDSALLAVAVATAVVCVLGLMRDVLLRSTAPPPGGATPMSS